MLRINLLIALMTVACCAHSQITETTIAPDETQDYIAYRILLSTENEVYISVGSGSHRPTPAGVPNNCRSNAQHDIYKLSADGELIAQEEFSRQFLFLDMIHIGGSRYAEMAMTECQEEYTEPNGIGHSYQGQTMVLGVVDTVGASDSTLNFIIGIQSPDCDLHMSRYLGTAYKNEAVHAVYQRPNDTDKCKYIWKVDPTTEIMEKIPTQRDFWLLQNKSDQTGFYTLFQDENNKYRCQLGELQLDGSTNIISSELSFEQEEDLPKFLYANGMLFTAASNYLNYTDVRRYDLDGSILGSFSTGYRSKKIFMTSFGLLVVQEPMALTNSGDSKPLKIRLFDFNVNEVGYREFGFENTNVHDFHFDVATQTLTMVGRVDHSWESDINQENKKAYFFRAKVSDIFPNATPIESTESGSIYPNPSNDSSVFLQLKNADDLSADSDLVLRFFDVQGKSVDVSYSKVSTSLYEIDSSELSAGTYLGVVETSAGERVFSELFVVDR